MFLLSVFLQVSIAWFYGHVLEYFLHRVMHDYRRFPFFFKHHFKGHHRISRKNQMNDDSYINVFTKTSLFEFLGLAIGLVVHLPVLFFFPFAYMTIFFSVIQYYWMHRKAHIDVDWGIKNMPWHYKHHMGKDQHANWGVRSDVIDIIMDTNVK